MGGFLVEVHRVAHGTARRPRRPMLAAGLPLPRDGGSGKQVRHQQPVLVLPEFIALLVPDPIELLEPGVVELAPGVVESVELPALPSVVPELPDEDPLEPLEPVEPLEPKVLPEPARSRAPLPVLPDEPIAVPVPLPVPPDMLLPPVLPAAPSVDVHGLELELLLAPGLLLDPELVLDPGLVLDPDGLVLDPELLLEPGLVVESDEVCATARPAAVAKVEAVISIANVFLLAFMFKTPWCG